MNKNILISLIVLSVLVIGLGIYGATTNIGTYEEESKTIKRTVLPL